MKRILITNVFGDLNKGDRALFEALIQILNTISPNIEIHAIVRHSSEFKTLYPKLVIHKQITKVDFSNVFEKYFKYFFILLSSSLYFYLPRLLKYFISKELKETLDAYKKTDLIISSPGGFIEDSNPSYYLQLFQILFGIFTRKKIVIAPQSIGPVKSKIGLKSIAFILNRVSVIFVREKESVKLIEGLKLNSKKLFLVPDLAFNYFKAKPTTYKKTDVIYSTVVNWNFPNQKHKEEKREEYKNALIESFKYVNKSFGKKIIILNQVETDLPMAYEIAKQLFDIVFVDEKSYTPEEMIEKIEGTEFFIGTRFHSCIFSMLTNVPVIAISYLPKTSGMLKMLDLEEISIDINKIDSNKIIEKITLIQTEYSKAKAGLHEKLTSIQKNNSFKEYLTEEINRINEE